MFVISRSLVEAVPSAPPRLRTVVAELLHRLTSRRKTVVFEPAEADVGASLLYSTANPANPYMSDKGSTSIIKAVALHLRCIPKERIRQSNSLRALRLAALIRN